MTEQSLPTSGQTPFLSAHTELLGMRLARHLSRYSCEHLFADMRHCHSTDVLHVVAGHFDGSGLVSRMRAFGQAADSRLDDGLERQSDLGPSATGLLPAGGEPGEHLFADACPLSFDRRSTPGCGRL
jgi:hypothetical protein